MKAEETVMSHKELSGIVWSEDGELMDANYDHTAKNVAKAQAETSFPAGIREGEQRMAERMSYTYWQKFEDHKQALKQVGMEEVVQFANQFAGIKHNPEWKAQLKDWGLEVEIDD